MILWFCSQWNLCSASAVVGISLLDVQRRRKQQSVLFFLNQEKASGWPNYGPSSTWREPTKEMEGNFLQGYVVIGQKREWLQAEENRFPFLGEEKSKQKPKTKTKIQTKNTFCSKMCRTSPRCVEVGKKFCHPSLQGAIYITSISIKPNLEIGDSSELQYHFRPRSL